MKYRAPRYSVNDALPCWLMTASILFSLSSAIFCGIGQLGRGVAFLVLGLLTLFTSLRLTWTPRGDQPRE